MVAAIAVQDWPEDWPSVLDDLIALTQSDDPQQVYGGVKTINLLAEDLAEDQMAHMVDRLSPELVRIVSCADKVTSLALS